ncbi:molybdenum cofactor guanylyltransferase MobA [Phyllobacterium endophyticum]|uniref:molybdenum cofactor guanylyltransferase MobA n=1 Tax=Phyllobacterium endophyticum TaxID=1149773 RepID=UPI001809246F|nr:molybdenum cofactor guanylyltransferase MobA [Phyllobacterium endophyticum]MBB3234147.1 molybdopterin-guanine dinucleotide biosynthesis protein A [Phyllobacterium endophyticum]
MRIAGAILAGGQSRRMDGIDKALLPFGEKRVIDHVFERLSRQITPVVLNSNNEPVLFMELPIPVVPDDIDGFAGPLAGILAAMEWANGQALPFTHIATVATDTPFFPDDLVDTLRRSVADERGCICVAASGGRLHPVFGIWPVSLRSDLRRWLSNENHRRVMAWLERHPHKIAEFPIRTEQSGVPLDPFFNINTPEDINEARRRWNAIS